MGLFDSKNYEGPAAADGRRANQLESCRKCKKAVDGFTWDRLGGYCPACARTEDKNKNNHKRLW